MSVKTYFLVLVLLSLLSVCWNIPVSVRTSDLAIFSPSSALTLFARAGSDEPLSMKENYRTIWGIILESGKTIVACSWTAVHTNIPPNIGFVQKKLQKFYIMLYAILVPEAILVWAVRQRVAAGALAKRYNKARGLSEGVKNPLWSRFLQFLRSLVHPTEQGNANTPWTTVHGFYVQMGGFVLYRGDDPLCVLTCDDLIELVQNEDVDPPNISEEEIKDKSKSNWLSKLVAMGQIVYFVWNVGINRLRRHLPKTHLELAVICLCSLSFLTYLFWFDKPLDVEVATPIRLVKKRGAREENSGAGGVGGHTTGTRSEGASGSARNIEDLGYSPAVTALMERLKEAKEPTYSHWVCENIRKDWDEYRKKRHAKIKFFIFLLGRLWYALFRPVVKLTNDSKERSGNLRVPMFGAAKVKEVSGEILVFFPVVLIAGTVFGGGHLIAWDWHFPTAAERSLWRACGIIIAAAPFVTFIIVVASEVTARKNVSRKEREESEERARASEERARASEERGKASGGEEASEEGGKASKETHSTLEIIWIILVDGFGIHFVECVTAPAYVAARMIVVVLMFTTLRSLPNEVYKD